MEAGGGGSAEGRHDAGAGGGETAPPLVLEPFDGWRLLVLQRERLAAVSKHRGEHVALAKGAAHTPGVSLMMAHTPGGVT